MKRKALLVLAALIGGPAYYGDWYLWLSSWLTIGNTLLGLLH